MSSRTGNTSSIGRLIARELRSTWVRCMAKGCENRAAKDSPYCDDHAALNKGTPNG